MSTALSRDTSTTVALAQDPESAQCPPVEAVPLRHSDDLRVNRYSSRFADVMEMRAPSHTVADYLDHHDGWFRRCAAPMTVQSLGPNGYALTLGRFGNFGFEVEPTIGLELLPQSEGVYRIVTAALSSPDASLQEIYDVEFNAALQLEEGSGAEPDPASETADGALTQVRWELDLCVWIRLPAVIGLLPDKLVQSSGDHLLRQIVRQISRKLTWKVQEDFHATHELPCPPRRRAPF
ncbi:hypothetical protein WH5701_01510 [Synechococcus sp. WH 5701]|nr:hypothetical protein WH5701_01510 [Synechococcus sp. WH 5701]